MTESYDFRIYNFNGSVVPSRQERFHQSRKNGLFSKRTRLHVASKNFHNAGDVTQIVGLAPGTIRLNVQLPL
jgi:hypothetical protein